VCCVRACVSVCVQTGAKDANEMFDAVRASEHDARSPLQRSRFDLLCSVRWRVWGGV
jgi:hypothetical protein